MSVGRNDPCPCGSGQKAKKCCGVAAAPAAAPAPAAGPSQAECQELIALFQAGQAARLESRARHLLGRHPTAGFLWNVLGAALGLQEKDSLEAFERAAHHLPKDPEVQANLGIAYAKQGRLAEAEACQRRALALRPAFAAAHVNLGNVLIQAGRQLDAEASFRRALQLQPGAAAAHGGLGDALIRLGRLAEAEPHLRQAVQLDPAYTTAQSSLLFLHNLRADLPADAMLAEARQYGAQVARQARPFATWDTPPDPARRLRIGLVSGDLGAHPVGYFLVGVLAAWQARHGDEGEFFAYSQRPFQDPVHDALRRGCSHWCATRGLADQALAQRIHDDRIDVLIDLAGHTAENRLPVFAFRPAPVQVTWLGYFATTGVAAIDYLLADPWSVPDGEDAHFTEQVWRLPETRLCFSPPLHDVPVAPLPALTTGRLTFGCFNNLAKMDDRVVAVWARLLAAVPGSRLFLKAAALNETAVQATVRERFAAHGVAAERLLLEPASPRADYLAAYHRVDVALDPFPYSGATTSAEAMWMGVPVLTLAGDRLCARQGLSLLHNAGLPDWIATDPDDYVARATRHAADLQRLAGLRQELRARLLASPVMDAPRFATHFAAALRGMWSHWCSRQAAPPPTG